MILKRSSKKEIEDAGEVAENMAATRFDLDSSTDESTDKSSDSDDYCDPMSPGH